MFSSKESRIINDINLNEAYFKLLTLWNERLCSVESTQAKLHKTREMSERNFNKHVFFFSA